MSRLRSLILNSLICFTSGFDFLRHVKMLFNELESIINVLVLKASSWVLTFMDIVLINRVK